MLPNYHLLISHARSEIKFVTMIKKKKKEKSVRLIERVDGKWRRVRTRALIHPGVNWFIKNGSP